MSFGLRGVSVEFGDVRAIDDVSLDVPGGEITSLVGGDGAGKSTALRCLAGLVAPSAGTVTRPDPRRIGYMPASSGVWHQLTVDENVEFVGRAFGLPTDGLVRSRDELLERAGLIQFRDRPAAHLSGGLRQKLGFVLAVVHRPELLVLDEPSTGVDPVSRVELWRLIGKSAAEGAAVVMATTYLDEAERTSVLHVLDHGRVLLAGPADDLASQMPGVVDELDGPTVPGRAWRRGIVVRQWRPEGEPMPASARPVEHPDLEDVVIGCMVARRSGGNDE